MSKVAFIGLGVMGYPMAGHLSKKFDTTVYNRTTEKSKKRLLKSLKILMKFGVPPKSCF